MKNQARREEPEESGSSQPDAPETLRFPPRERPTTRRRTPQAEPYDVERYDAERDERAQQRAEEDLAAEQAREADERRQAVLDARAALAERRPVSKLDSVVWDAHEAIQSSLGQDPDDRPRYVPIASSEPRATLDPTRPAPPGSVYVAPYNLPEYSPAPKATWLDVLRRSVTTLVAAAFLVVTCGTVFGDLAVSNAFSWHNAAVAPLLVAAVAWPVMALSFLASAVHSWWPDQRSARRQRATTLSWPLTAVAGAGWCVAAANDLPWASLIASVVMVAAAGYGVHQFNLLTARNKRERWLSDAPLEFALGWGAFTFCWSAAAWISELHVNLGPPSVWGVIVLVIGLVPVFMVGSTERGRVLSAVGFAWGTAWLLPAAIISGHVLVMVIALVGALAAFLAALARRHAIASAERKA